MTADQQHPASNGVDADALTATILTAVERQLTRYFSAMSQQAEAARHLAEATKSELDERVPLIEAALTAQAEQFPLVEALIDAQRQGIEDYQVALQTALEERLSEFANHQHWRLNDLEDKVAAIPTDPAGFTPEDLMEIRQTVRDDMERSFAAINGRLDELANGHRKFDEQTAAFVLHVNDTTAALAQRMDDGDLKITVAMEQHLANAQAVFTNTLADIETQVGDHTNTLLQKLEAADSRVTDRMLALEARINEEQGTKLANIEATVGRIGAGFDEAMIAINQRVLELENRLLLMGDQFDSLAQTVSRIDQDAIDELKSQMSNAVGEAMLVRIELDRVVNTTEERFDKQAVRLGEIEALLTDEMDVGTAVQLERLDELERAVAMLDPAKYTGTPAAPAAPEVNQSMFGSGASDTGTVGPITGSNRVLPTLTLNPRLPGADSSHGGGADTDPGNGSSDHEATASAYEQDSTYTSH